MAIPMLVSADAILLVLHAEHLLSCQSQSTQERSLESVGTVDRVMLACVRFRRS